MAAASSGVAGRTVTLLASAIAIGSAVSGAASTLGKPTGALEGAPQEELDLPVDRPEIIRGPLLEGRERLRVQAQQERLPLGHDAQVSLVDPIGLR